MLYKFSINKLVLLLLFIPLNFNLLGFNVLLSFILLLIVFIISFIKDGVKLNLTFLNYVLLFIVYALAVNIFSKCDNYLLKSLISLALIISLLFSIFLYSNLSSINYLEKIVFYYIIFISIFFPFELFLNYQLENNLRISSFFSEPSHFALFVAPILVPLLFSSDNKHRAVSFLLIVFLIFFSPSSTLFIALLMASILCGLYFSKNIILLIIPLFIFIFYSNYFSDFFIRFSDIFNDINNINLSTLVYINGWEISLANLLTTNFLGLGFNRMGCNPTVIVPSSLVLIESGRLISNGNIVNYNDGSFIFSKILSELGLIGVLLTAYLLKIFSTMFIFKNRYRNLTNFQAAFIISAISTMFISIFIRGTSYFSLPFILGLYCISILIKINRSTTNDSRY